MVVGSLFIPWVIWLVGSVGAYGIAREYAPWQFNLYYALALLFVSGLVVRVYFAYRYVKSLARKPLWSLLSVFGLLGWLALAFLYDYSRGIRQVRRIHHPWRKSETHQTDSDSDDPKGGSDGDS